MPIYMYEEWLQESERVDPQPEAQPPAQPQVDPSAGQPAIETPPAPSPDNGDIETGLENPEEETTQSEQEEFEEIDSARKEAISAFKDKQKEFMEIPQEVRNNPVSDEDKTKVESLKAELQTLNTNMKDAVARYDEFNDKMLGSTTDTDEEP